MYFLLIKYFNCEDLIVMNTGRGKPVSAKEHNAHLLLEVGKQLLESNTISFYQLVKAEDHHAYEHKN